MVHFVGLYFIIILQCAVQQTYDLIKILYNPEHNDRK